MDLGIEKESTLASPNLNDEKIADVLTERVNIGRSGRMMHFALHVLKYTHLQEKS